MRVVCISDTHERHRDLVVPDGDVLIHAGDITNRGHQSALLDFNDWMGTLPHKHKVVIAGNHDISLESERHRLEPMFTNFTYLAHEECEIEGFKFFGSPYSREFHPDRWAFQAMMGDRSDLTKALWDLIPSDVDVLITHGPIRGVLDVCPDYYAGVPVNVGDHILLDRWKDFTQLKLHVCGHVHESYGKVQFSRYQMVNASSLNFSTQKMNAPIVVDL